MFMCVQSCMYRGVAIDIMLFNMIHADASAGVRRRFTNCLALMVWVSVAWIAYEMYFKVGPPYLSVCRPG